MIATATQQLDPGLHLDLPAEEYHALNLASNSLLGRMLQSPAHTRWAMDNPSPTTPALKMGSAVHAAVLEPDKFAAEWTVLGPCCAELASGKRKGERCGNSGAVVINGESFCGMHSKGFDAEDANTLGTNDAATCRAVHDAVRAHPVAAKLLDAARWFEGSMLWNDSETGVSCKARADAFAEVGGGTIIDLKTTQDASPLAFERSIFNFGYHRQAAHYLAAAQSCGIEANHFVIIAVEKSAPFGCAVYRLDDSAVLAGDTQRLRLLERWAECESTGDWPGYPSAVNDIGIPIWAERLIDNGEL